MSRQNYLHLNSCYIFAYLFLSSHGDGGGYKDYKIDLKDRISNGVRVDYKRITNGAHVDYKRISNGVHVGYKGLVTEFMWITNHSDKYHCTGGVETRHSL